MTLEKRTALERFIREQTLGPGIVGHRYVDIQNEQLLLNDLASLLPVHHLQEIINNAPGAMYSTGILFPQDATNTAVVETEPNNMPDEEQDDNIEGSHENVIDTDITEETISVNQMYPNSMGLTFSLNSKITDPKEIQLTLQARYYTKLKRKDLPGRYGILLQQDLALFNAFINSLDPESPVKRGLVIRTIGKNTIITYASFHPDDIKLMRTAIREIDKTITAKLGSEKQGQTLSGFKEFLFRELRYTTTDKDAQSGKVRKISEIENAESSIAHLTDLVDIFDTRGYGLWQSELYTKQIEIPHLPEKITGKTILSYKEYPDQLKDILRFDLGEEEFASLSVNLQFSKDPRGKKDNLFLKVQLVNTSTKFRLTEGDARYFSAFNEVVNQRSFFGVKIQVQSHHLLPYRTIEGSTAKTSFEEDDITEVLYDQFKDYAVGHGASVRWDKTQHTVETEYIPSFDTPDVDPTPRRKDILVKKNDRYEPESIFADASCMQFKALSLFSGITDDELIAGLNSFVHAYADWIQRKRLHYAAGKFTSIAVQELDKCTEDMERMRSNILKILTGDQNTGNLQSFRLMNAAMFMQLWHSVHVKNDTVERSINETFTSFDEPFYREADDQLFAKGIPAAWRPFQLAFILLNLDGIFQRDDDPQWDKRNNLVDLVWFPTGGGKTEAYLGIIALTIINRRRTWQEQGGGTAVLMRYTLRLLTLQQFQRASLLIMALELLRRWDKYQLGAEPIYIGLWVGQGSLPNSLDDLEDEYKRIRAAQGNSQHLIASKIPFDKCPWCGHRLDPIDYERINDQQRTYDHNRVLLRCSRKEYKCSFSIPTRKKLQRVDHGPIPVSLCDEEIYQHPPALLFGTVDKFAQLAHKVSDEPEGRHKDSRRIFGQGNWEPAKLKRGQQYLPPDLIIQDELHLLLGPLGSSVALFESAIDQLCTANSNGRPLRPKVISSTATTRNTALQIMALFDRKLNIFPKPGIECDDCFYSFYERDFHTADGQLPVYRSKRKYIGILPTGRTPMWMQMRLSAILLVHRAIFESQKLADGSPILTGYDDDLLRTLDNYHTMLTYFNSLREVGKTESQINTYIIKEIRRVFNKVLRPGKMMHSLYTYSLNSGELTGRLSGEDVKKELDKVSSKWSPEKRFAHIDDKGNKQRGTAPPDIVVATNMISVGIDVARFNTIIMNGMPRNLAEYIQASSRVARNTYGLVLTVHHPFRARDISHYEKFIEFHEKMYSYVEPISITPFTRKAVSRYLSLYLATMIRHRTDFINRKSAANISGQSKAQLDQLLQQLVRYFADREQRLSTITGIDPLIRNLLKPENVKDIEAKLSDALQAWKKLADETNAQNKELVFNNKAKKGAIVQEQLYVEIDEYEGNIHSRDWQVPQSLRVIEPEAVIKIKHK